MARRRFDVAGVRDVADVAMVLRDPQPDVGRAGHDACFRMRHEEIRERVDRARRPPVPAVGGVGERFRLGKRRDRGGEP
jgi:hypothetical protein